MDSPTQRKAPHNSSKTTVTVLFLIFRTFPSHFSSSYLSSFFVIYCTQYFTHRSLPLSYILFSLTLSYPQFPKSFRIANSPCITYSVSSHIFHTFNVFPYFTLLSSIQYIQYLLFSKLFFIFSSSISLILFLLFLIRYLLIFHTVHSIPSIISIILYLLLFHTVHSIPSIISIILYLLLFHTSNFLASFSVSFIPLMTSIRSFNLYLPIFLTFTPITFTFIKVYLCFSMALFFFISSSISCCPFLCTVLLK